jgi:molecular chaperone Hsp33
LSATATRHQDLIQAFQVDGLGVRGRLVRLGPVADDILGRHDYPGPAAAILGEALALTAMLAGALKIEGMFTLQTKTDGPVSMLVVDYRSPGVLRGYASVDRGALNVLARAHAAPGAAQPSVPRTLGAGHLAFTVDPGEGGERFQGLVDLNGATMAECAQFYFRQSEQIGANFRLAVGQASGAWRAGGMMIQRLPAAAGAGAAPTDESWREAGLLGATVRDDELLDPELPPNDLLYRLFHRHGVRVWKPKQLRFGCSCSGERVEQVLRTFSGPDMAEMAVDGRIVVTCEFCNAVYEFAAAAFASGAPFTNSP